MGPRERNSPGLFAHNNMQPQQQQLQQQYDERDDTTSSQLQLLLNELTFWEPSSSATTNNNSNMPPSMKQPQCSYDEEQITALSATQPSPTLQELEAANTWQKAVDPSSGRTYYYDSITRQSQWEKVSS